MSDLRDKVTGLEKRLESRIVGQEDLIRKMLITLLAGGHAQAAAPLAEELEESITRHRLDDWQRDACLDALRVCHAVWAQLETPEARQRATATAAAICRLRPSCSPYL